MSSANILWSTERTSPFFVSSGTLSAAPVVAANSEESFTIAVPAGPAITSSSRIAASRLVCNRARSYLSVGAQRSSARKAIETPSAPQEKTDADEPSALASAALPEPSTRSAPTNERVQLIIDSLQNYDLIKPIPVIIDSLADKIFTAEAPDLNLSISENSFGGALLLLKDRIAKVYEEYRMKKILDPGQVRQLEILQAHIGKAKRSWR